jgi:D-alanyl-D-alanine carboxypeptidase
MRRDLVSRLQRIQRTQLARAPLRHSLVAVERDDGSLRWLRAAGDAQPSGNPMAADTPYFIASIDKLFNAAIALRLTEQGRLALEAPIQTYLPQALIRGLHRLRGVDHSERITVRHLLSHTSGLPDWLEDRKAGGRPFVDSLLTHGDRSVSLEDIVAMVRDLPAHFAPQDPSVGRPRIRYSDSNFVLLVAIIESVTGESLVRVHERLLLQPLGMTRTWFAGRSAPVDPVVEPAALHAEGRPLQVPQLMRSIWGIYSTAADQLRFMRALTNGEIFADPATFQLMQRWNRFGLPLDRAALRLPGWPIEYGLGLMRFQLSRMFTRFRRLPAVLGHTGSTGTWLFHCPEWDLFLAGAVNEVSAGAVPYRVVPAILDAVRDAGESISVTAP